MSIKNVSHNNDLLKIAGEKETPKDTQIAKVENDLQYEKDSRKEERFYWIFGIVLIIDAFIFPNAQSSSGVILLGILQLVFLIVLAACLGLESVSIIISKVLNSFIDKSDNTKGF
jgi:uncharacterized membrane protein